MVKNRSVSDYETTEPTILDIFQVSCRMGDDVMVTFQVSSFKRSAVQNRSKLLKV
jgi:hypothetical protein